MLTNAFFFFSFVSFLTLDLKIGLDKDEVLDNAYTMNHSLLSYFSTNSIPAQLF